jgi:HEAT repeat protein
MSNSESIQALLSAADAGDRISGINQLRQIDPALAFQLIQPAITDTNVRVRYAAVSQIASLGLQDRHQALHLLRDRLLNDPETDVQAAAADSLGALKLTEAYDDLAQLYHSTSEWLIQVSIVAALSEMGEPRAFDLLCLALGADNELVRTVAIGALGEFGDPRAIPLLIPYAQSGDWQVRYRVVQALSRLDGPEVKATLEHLAQDEVASVAQEAQAYLNAL